MKFLNQHIKEIKKWLAIIWLVSILIPFILSAKYSYIYIWLNYSLLATFFYGCIYYILSLSIVSTHPFKSENNLLIPHLMIIIVTLVLSVAQIIYSQSPHTSLSLHLSLYTALIFLSSLLQ